jgi:hypothetical protein
MKYFLSVETKDGDFLHKDEQHDSLEDVLKTVSAHYLADPTMPHRWSGYFAMRDGEITSLKIKRGTAGIYLREDIAEIGILSQRGKLERDTLGAAKN